MMLPDEFVLPDYTTGTTIANVPATVAALLGASFDGLPTLPTAVWRPLGHPHRVVLLILDALGRNLLDTHPETWSAVGQQALVNETITSVFPSTTVTCLSCLWTGRAPSQHGLISLYMYLPEFAAVGQLLQLTPRLGKYPNALVDAGLDTETFLPVPSVAQQLAAQGIPTHSFKGQEIIDSALSKMHDRGVAHQHGAVSFADMMCQMAAVLEEKPAAPLYLCGFWPTLDTLCHIYTPQHPIVAAELQTLFYQIEQFFLRPLSPAARQDTVFLIVADHGQIPFCPHPRFVEPRPRHATTAPRLQGSGEPRPVCYTPAKGNKQPCKPICKPITPTKWCRSRPNKFRPPGYL